MGNDQSRPQRRFTNVNNPRLARSHIYHPRRTIISSRSEIVSIPSRNSNLSSPPPYTAQETHRPLAASDVLVHSPYAFLAEFDTIFVMDDSYSMRMDSWIEAQDAIAAIAPICTQYNTDGIDIYFLTYRWASTAATTGAYTNIKTADDVRTIFREVIPLGLRHVGRRLYEILCPYMERLGDAIAASGPVGATKTVKPVNIIVITNGAFTDDAQSVVMDVARRLDMPQYRAVPWQVGIQFFQVGDNREAREYLQALDDELGRASRDERLRDIVDTVPWRGERGQTLSAEGILQRVLGAVNRKYDRQDGH